MCLELVRKLAYYTSQKQYAEIQSTKGSCPTNAVKYFNENWGTIKDEWFLVSRVHQETFLIWQTTALNVLMGSWSKHHYYVHMCWLF